MKRTKYLALVLAALLCIALSGCEQIAYNLLEGVQQSIMGGSSSAPEETSEAGRSAATPAVPSVAPWYPAPTSQPDSVLPPEMTDIQGYIPMIQLVGMENEALKVIGEEADVHSEIYLGGTPVVVVTDEDGTLFIVFWLAGDYDAMMQAWEQAERPSAQDMPAYNCFPDDFTIDRITCFGDYDYMYDLFGVSYASPDEIAAVTGASYTENYVPATTGEGMEMGYDMDTYEYIYNLSGGTILARYDGGGEAVNVEFY